MNKIKLLLLIFISQFPLLLVAQKTPCMVVTSNFDTLFGVFIKADETLVCNQGVGKQHIVLNASEVYEYAFLEEDGTAIPYQFLLHPESGERTPMRRIVDGSWKLYTAKEAGSSSVNPALPKNSSVAETVTNYYLASYSEDAMRLSSKNWKAVLRERLSDCPPLLAGLRSNEYKFKHLPAMVASYNAYMRMQKNIAVDKRVDAPVLERE